MNTWFRKIGMGAVALTLAGVLGGCNNGDGVSLLRLFFGINGGGSCNSVIVDVNLDDADAIISRDSEGNPECELNQSLDNAGCTLTVQELENGDLRATVSGCTIPGVTNLFSCLFEDVDISDLQQTAEGQCACTNAPGCDETPPVCISEDPDPTSCEDCDNGIDDDGNGEVDCEDPNCSNNPICGSTTTTSTTVSSTITTSSTQTTTTTSSTVTTVTIEPALTCHVFLRLNTDDNLGSLQFDTDYSNAPGSFLGQGGDVECEPLVQNAFASFNDKDAQQVLTTGIISVTGVQGPTNVADCTFQASTQPVPADFAITITEASDPNLDPVEGVEVVVQGPIVCTGQPPTTTLPQLTTTTEFGTTTTTTGTATSYSVLFSMTAASEGAGALQFHTDYTGAPGDFNGSGASVQCTNLVSNTFNANNDIDTGPGVPPKVLNMGIISTSPISAPIDLIRCTFTSNGEAPTTADFPVVIDDATNVEGGAITATIITKSVTPIP